MYITFCITVNCVTYCDEVLMNLLPTLRKGLGFASQFKQGEQPYVYFKIVHI